MTELFADLLPTPLPESPWLLATVNTHDMPTFEAFIQAKDADDMESLGFFTPERAQAEHERRAAIRWMLEEALPPEERGKGAATSGALLRQRLEHLAASPARIRSRVSARASSPLSSTRRSTTRSSG